MGTRKIENFLEVVKIAHLQDMTETNKNSGKKILRFAKHGFDDQNLREHLFDGAPLFFGVRLFAFHDFRISTFRQ